MLGTVPANVENTQRTMTGRAMLFSDASKVDASNVVEVVLRADGEHMANAAQESYLWDYYRGIQPVLSRSKDVRPEINNRIAVNIAQEIVAFKIGYQLAEPMQYTCRTYGDDGGGSGQSATLADVNALNTMMFAEDKASADRDLFEWMCVCGVGYRMAEADSECDAEAGGAPFEVFTLDPRDTYVVRSSHYHRHPLVGVWRQVNAETGEVTLNAYTPERVFRIRNGEVVNGDGEPHTYGHVPIVEYQLNNARMGVFEPVLPLLDAINAIESNRLDDIEQNVQALMKFVDCDITREDFTEMLKLGAVKVTSVDGQRGDIDVISNPLDQSATQVTKDDLYQAVVNICGMPNRNGTSGSSSDTGAAVLLRDGWTLAESHAKGYELQMKRAERDFLRVVLAICEQSASVDMGLRIRDIELAFNRRNYENILVKSQVLTTMLSGGLVHPRLAFEACGMFTDPEAAYLLSCEWRDMHEDGEGGMQEDPAPIGHQGGVPEPDGDDAAKPAFA